MCGIAGGVALERSARPDPARVERMARRLAHRGPDAEGIWTAPSGRAVLAHRRLSVIDLVSGQQPMIGAGGETGLVFNGEIYDYRELRAELVAGGARFQTDSDTEVLLRLYESEGMACVSRLRGMFAFAAWDDRSGRLVMARDRVGKKPLYYTIDAGSLYFASSLSALREALPRAPEIDTHALDAFMTFSYVPAPRTIFRGISKLAAGTVLTSSGTGVDTSTYWDLSPAHPAFDGSETEAIDRLEDLVSEAVRLRLRSDVPIGVFLSGGIDSSLVTAVAARLTNGQLQTFSIGFGEAAFDETDHAVGIARHLGTEHRVFRAEPDLMELLPDMVWHYGEPFADASALPLWLLAGEARKHITVALSGDGGDEGFAGYDWYRTAARLGRVTRAVPAGAFAAASSALDRPLGYAFPDSRAVSRLRRGMAMLGTTDGPRRFAALRSFMAAGDAAQLYAGALEETRNVDGDPADRLSTLYEDCAGDSVRRMRWTDMATYLADGLMPKVDVATMASGLEARAPLLDQDVLRFAMTLPDRWLVSGAVGKRPLRALLDRYFPSELFDRPKRGFDVPLASWFSGSVRRAVDDLPDSERLLDSGWFRPAGLRRMLHEQHTGIRDHTQRLFNFLVLDEWLKRT